MKDDSALVRMVKLRRTISAAHVRYARRHQTCLSQWLAFQDSWWTYNRERRRAFDRATRQEEEALLLLNKLTALAGCVCCEARDVYATRRYANAG